MASISKTNTSVYENFQTMDYDTKIIIYSNYYTIKKSIFFILFNFIYIGYKVNRIDILYFRLSLSVLYYLFSINYSTLK